MFLKKEGEIRRERERERERERQIDRQTERQRDRQRERAISRTSFLTRTLFFDLGDQNFMTVRVDGQIHSPSLKRTLPPVAYPSRRWGCPRGVMIKAMDCGIVVREFVLQSQLLRSLSGKYPWERYKPPYLPSYGFNSTTTVLLGEWLWHINLFLGYLITKNGWYAIKHRNQTKPCWGSNTHWPLLRGISPYESRFFTNIFRLSCWKSKWWLLHGLEFVCYFVSMKRCLVI